MPAMQGILSSSLARALLHTSKLNSKLMFNWFKDSKTKTKPRQLNHPRDLRKGDLLTLKPRSIVPENLQDATLTVESVQAYQYSEGLVPEFVLRSTTGETLTMQVAEEEDGEYICFAKKLSHTQVISIFNEAEFAEVFGEDTAELSVNKSAIPDTLLSWIGESYYQTIKEGVAFFYKDDRRGQGVSQFEDDDSEELRFHECEAHPDQYSLNIEIWEDGSTDVYAALSMPINVIEEMWPNGNE